MVPERKEIVLLIDDDQHLLLTLGDYLQTQGYAVVTASSGENALIQLKNTAPDLIILDIGMPGMGGIAFLKQIRDNPLTPRYPVLVFSARTYMQDFFDHVAVDAFLAKPCEESVILAKIDEIIRKHRSTHVERNHGKLKILYAEGDSRLSSEISKIFQRAGHRVRRISHGPEVVKTALLEKPDVIVMNEVLPGLNGSAAAIIMQSLDSLSCLPVVLYDDTILMSGDRHPFASRMPKGVSRCVHSTSGELILQAVEEAFFHARHKSATRHS